MLNKKQEYDQRKDLNNWIWKDPQRREELTQIYNRLFNSIRPREYNGDHLEFPGMNPEITLRKQSERRHSTYSLWSKCSSCSRSGGQGRLLK